MFTQNETKLQALQEAMNKEYDRKIVQEERIRNLLLKKAQLEQHNKEKLQRKTEVLNCKNKHIFFLFCEEMIFLTWYFVELQSQEMVKQLKERIVLSPSEYEHKTKELEEQMSAMSEEINENASLISSKTQSLQLLDNLKVVGEGFGKSLKELESDKEKLKWVCVWNFFVKKVFEEVIKAIFCCCFLQRVHERGARSPGEK